MTTFTRAKFIDRPIPSIIMGVVKAICTTNVAYSAQSVNVSVDEDVAARAEIRASLMAPPITEESAQRDWAHFQQLQSEQRGSIKTFAPLPIRNR